MSFVICCDFDGTITLTDTGKVLLSSLTEKDWQYYDKLVISGEIGTRAALVKQWGMVEATNMDEIFSIVDTIKIDPTFKDFFEWITRKNISFSIISDGFKTYISRILRNNNIDENELIIKANDMKLLKGKIIVDFLTEQCEHNCANCKYSHVKKLKVKNTKVIYIGDGLSDIFPAKELADYIFAKKNDDLEQALKGDPRLIVFRNFNDIKDKIVELIEYNL